MPDNNISLPTTLHPNRTKMALLFLVCAAFVVIPVWMVRDGQSMGYLTGVFFALGLPVFAVQLLPNATYLQLRSDGFTFCSLFRAHTFQWRQVQTFAAIHVGVNPMVAWNFTADYVASGGMRRASKAFSGYEAALPDTYGMKAQELADLLNELRRSYAADGNAG